jgi:hypothetical protein
MKTVYEHHQDSIRFAYRCFDRILLNGLLQPFQQPERVVGFFNTYRELYPVSKPVLKDIARQHDHWVTARAKDWKAPIVEPPAHQRRDDFVDRYFRRADPDQIVVILKAREPARILIAIGKDDRGHLEYARRWVIQYNFYLRDREWGRMFVRVCPCFPFSARVCLNQHHWLAHRLGAEGISFRQYGNAFLTCGDPMRLQHTAVALDTTPDQYRLASLRSDLSKLRAKGLVERVPHSRRYRLLPHGYSICLVFLKLFERVYAPLTAGLLKPATADSRVADEKRHRLDRLYQRIVTDLDALLEAVGLRTAA